MALTGFWVNGVCAASQAEAVSALNSQFPVVQQAYMHVGSAVAYSTNGASLSVYTLNLAVSGGAWIFHGMSFSFSPCDPLLTNPPFDYVQAGAFWVFAFSFTIGIWFLAKNLGLILKAIKEF